MSGTAQGAAIAEGDAIIVAGDDHATLILKDAVDASERSGDQPSWAEHAVEDIRRQSGREDVGSDSVPSTARRRAKQVCKKETLRVILHLVLKASWEPIDHSIDFEKLTREYRDVANAHGDHAVGGTSAEDQAQAWPREIDEQVTKAITSPFIQRHRPDYYSLITKDGSGETTHS